MQWSPQQDNALNAVSEWLADPSRQVFRLFGFAGTGKTTLAKHLGNSHSGLVQYAAFTGKAALVLRHKGCADASTIHSLLYLPAPKSRLQLHELQAKLAATEGRVPDPKEVRELERAIDDERERLRQPAFSIKEDPLLTPRGRISLIVVDEVSMVDERLGRDLLSTGVKILVLGDPAQLPPVAGGGFFTNVAPDFLLTEVHRQALDSPVLKLATIIRKGEQLKCGTYGDSMVCERGGISPEDYAAADQVLVGYNATRRGANRRLREMAGYEGQLPMPGERLVCLRNDNDAYKRLLNGSLWSVIRSEDRMTDDTFDLVVESLDEAVSQHGLGRRVRTECHKYTFMGTEQPEWHDLLRSGEQGDYRINEFDFGYALTVHKAQGSQWDSVVVIDEWSRADRKKWLYTAITRAAERVVVVQQ